jgi:branched-chain amino acid transport system permease protein
MVYGILKFINFAHGEILMMGTYIAFFLFTALSAAITPGLFFIFFFFIALSSGAVFSALLGVVVERLAYKPLRNAPRLAPLLSAIGVSIILMNLAGLFFGTKSKKFPYPFDNSPIDTGLFTITPHQILILVVSLVLMLGLRLFISRTRWGKAMRATSEDKDIAGLMGINANFIISLTFFIGSALAATAGVLVALEFKVYPTMGTLAGLKAFVAAVVGGIGNITGAMIGAILLGVLETFGVALLGIPVGFKDTIAFGILILMLLFRPSGILGQPDREKV